MRARTHLERLSGISEHILTITQLPVDLRHACVNRSLWSIIRLIYCLKSSFAVTPARMS